MGELYIKAETAMLGYFSKDGKSRQITDEEGWTCTGQLKNVFVKIVNITDKDKYIFKTDNTLMCGFIFSFQI